MSVPEQTVPHGYKRTEVGVIPEDWGVKTIGLLFEVTAGGDFDPSRSGNIQDEHHPYPVYSNALTDAGLYGYTSHANHEAGSITVTARGTLGVAHFRDHPFTAIGRVLVLTPRDREVEDGRYFAAYLNHRIDFVVESTGVPQLTAPQISKYMLPIPHPNEQRAIAEALSDVDALLAALDARIAKQRAIKTAAMQRLLTGKQRLPDFDGKWEIKRIGEFADCTAGGTPSTTIDEYWGGTIKWMSSGELHLKIVHDVEGRITEAGLRDSSAKLLPPNCVLIGLAGQGKTRGTVAMNVVELCTNQSIAAILPNNSFDPTYLYYNLDNRYEELRALSTGDGGRGGLNLKIIRSIPIPFPPLDEQRAIAAVLSDMDAAIAALEAQRAKTAHLKQAMMQELLTGRTRLV